MIDKLVNCVILVKTLVPQAWCEIEQNACCIMKNKHTHLYFNGAKVFNVVIFNFIILCLNNEL